MTAIDQDGCRPVANHLRDLHTDLLPQTCLDLVTGVTYTPRRPHCLVEDGKDTFGGHQTSERYQNRQDHSEQQVSVLLFFSFFPQRIRSYIRGHSSVT